MQNNTSDSRQYLSEWLQINGLGMLIVSECMEELELIYIPRALSVASATLDK